MTHTPTPWKYEKYGNDTDVNNTHEIFTDCETEYYIANVNRETNPVGNAEFIVRACNAHDDLVSALENLLSQYGTFPYAWSEKEINEDEDVIFARKAIAKAKGE